MTLKVTLTGTMTGNGVGDVEIYNPFVDGNSGKPGLLTYSEPRFTRGTTTRPFLNALHGDNFAKDGSAGGATETIHDGGDSVGWTGSIVSGTWDFADTTDPDTGTNHISITLANNNDQADFDTGSPVDASAFSICRIRVNLQAYNAPQNSMQLSFNIGGVPVGFTVDLEDYLDPSVIGSYQTASVPLSDLGIDAATVDGCSILIGRSGGAKPTIYFDNFELRGSGGLVFTVFPDNGTRFYIKLLRFVFIDVVTGSAAKAYDKILAATLTNGITINRESAGVTTIGRSILNIADFAKFGATISDESFLDDGTNTMLVFDIMFEDESQVIDSKTNDKFSLTLNDDLSGMIEANVYARGVRIENT